LDHVVGGVGGRSRKVPPVNGEAGAVWHGEAVLDENAEHRVLPRAADGGTMGERGQGHGKGAIELPRVALEAMVSQRRGKGESTSGHHKLSPVRRRLQEAGEQEVIRTWWRGRARAGGGVPSGARARGAVQPGSEGAAAGR
jgi:hypothetical protein